MSADRADRADHADPATGDVERDAFDDGQGYYLVSPSPTTKKRHRPDETGDEPACRAFLQRDDAEWRTLSARQTVMYDDCANCFPRE